MDDHKNLAVSAVATAPSPAASGTSLVVTAAHGTRFPAVPFNATVWPTAAQPTPANAEIVRVTAVATDTLTIVRAQEGTSARTVVVGDQIAATVTDKTLTDIERQFIRYTYDSASTADSDPGAGLLRFNDADPTAATFVYLDNVDADVVNRDAWAESWGADLGSSLLGLLRVSDAADPANFVLLAVYAVTSASGYNKLSVSSAATGGTLPAGPVLLDFDFAPLVTEAPDIPYETRSTNTILGVADKGKTIDITAAITQTFTADETLGDGWWCILRNATDDGTTWVTLDPAGSETIDGIAIPIMYSGEARLIMCNGAGANFNSVLLSGGYARYISDANFQVPHGITACKLDGIGGGGGGGGGRGGSAATVRKGGGGGGGGGRRVLEFAASDLGNPGDTIAVDVGAGGTSGPGGSAANGTSGGVGASTTFGSLFTAYGGGGGMLGDTATGSNHSWGGSGGAHGEAGLVGLSGASPSRGGGTIAWAANIIGFGGAGSGSSYPAEWGGCGGGGSAGTGTGPVAGLLPATSTYGGGGGGGGGGLTTGNAETAGAAGGNVGLFLIVGVGGGGTSGTTNGGAGGVGADGNGFVSGKGGGGGGSQDSGTGGAGGNGGAPGGGGGGGGGGTTVGGAGGVGGRGELRVWYS